LLKNFNIECDMETITINVDKGTFVSTISDLLYAIKKIPVKYWHLPMYTSIVDGASIREIKIDSDSIMLI